MYIKLLNTVGSMRDAHILEGKDVSWRRIQDDDERETVESCLDTGDYGLYNNPKKISLEITLDDTMLLLEQGDVYIMNDNGKTIDSIHA